MRRVAALVATMAVLAVSGVAAPAEAWTRPPGRLGGGNRYETAALLSRSAFGPGVPAAVVVSGVSFPDGLVAGPLAALLGGPVLLTEPDSLPAATLDELRRLTPQQIVVVGGSGVVGQAVADQLATLGASPLRRLAGEDRYDTAATVAAEFAPGPGQVLLATGEHYADALAAGALAAADARPLLLSGQAVLPASIAAQLQRLAPGRVVLVGGTNALGEEVAAQVGAVVPAPVRLAGGDRYGTAALLSHGRPATRAYLAVGHGWADALAASAVAGKVGSPVVLTEPDCVPQPTVEALRAMGWPDLVAVGGTGVVSSAALGVVPCTPVADGEVFPGLTVETRRLPGPRIARILTVDRRRGLEVVAAPATGRLTGRLPTTSISRRWNALAAVNGDFFNADGSPVHALVSRGRLLRAPGLSEALAAWREGGADAGSPVPSVALALADGRTVTIDRVNDGQPAGGISILTAEAGGRVDTVDRCAAALTPLGAPAAAFGAPTSQRFRAGEWTCQGGVVPVGPHDVLVSPLQHPVSAAALGEVRLEWRLRPEWTGHVEAMGGNCLLLVGGAISTDVINRPEAFFRERAPRTAIGWRADGQLLLVTVDGRQDGWSIGMTPRELADLMRELGAVDAVNLDGGGSTTMAVRGVLANRPSEAAGERAVGPAVLVVPTGTPTPAPYG